MNPPTYTAAHYAAILGVSKRCVSVRLEQAGTSATRTILARGQEADAWEFMALPGRLQGDLVEAWHRAEKATGASPWRDFAHFLSDPPPPAIEAPNLEAETPKAVKPQDFAQVEAAILSIGNYPSRHDKALVLQTAFETLESALASGRPQKKFTTALYRFLEINAPYLPRSSRLRDLRAAWKTNGRSLEALLDKRTDANQKRKVVRNFPQADLDRLVSCAIKCHGKSIQPAWEELRHRSPEQGGFSPEARGFGPNCPGSLRRLAFGMADELYLMVHQPKKAMNNGAFTTRDWSGVNAGDWFSADDFTLEVYFYIPDGAGWWTLTRGQCLLMIDERSLCILDFMLIPEKGFTGAHIRNLINRIGLRFGLPNRGFHFERGPWERAKLVGGSVPWGEVQTTFASRLGIKMQHSLPGNAKAKSVEFVGRFLQNRLRRYPGWAGPNEQVFKVEKTAEAKRDVEARRKTPWEAGFYSFEQWHSTLQSECVAYNHRQFKQSKIIGGNQPVKMSPEEAWAQLQPRNERGEIVPPINLKGTGLEHLLCDHCEEIKVTRKGIRFQHDGQDYAYSGEATGTLVGHTVKCSFNVESPEFAYLETETGERFIVELQRDMPAHDAAKDDYEHQGRTVGAHNRTLRARASELPHDFMPDARPVMADRKTIEIGRAMDATRRQIAANRKAESDIQTTARRAARDMGLEGEIPPRSAGFLAALTAH